VLDPSETPVVRPVLWLTVATDVALEVQMAAFVTLAVVPSEYIPAAVSCVVAEIATSAGLGVIAMDTRIAGVTVSVVLAEMEPSVAVITVEPGVRDVASPVALTVAILDVLELQVTLFVRLEVLVSL
jgi:hypothetical protein